MQCVPAPGEITVAGTVKCALSWSGGKDSALALWMLRGEGHETAA